MIARRVSPALLALTVLFSSCRKPEVQSYRVTKETSPAAAATTTPNSNPPPAAPPGGAMANTAVPTASGAALTWTAPAHWTLTPGPAMRKATYLIKAAGTADEAELTVTAFPGDVGGDLANLNRWRGQIGLAPITQAELESTTQHLDRNGLHMTVVDVAGTGDGAKRILGAMVPHDGATWFFKFTGSAALAAKEKAAFTAFLDTIKPAAP